MMLDLTSWTLIRCAAGGDPAACDKFAKMYLPTVRAYLRARWSGRLSDEEIEEAVQEVFLACLRDDGVLDRVDRSGEKSFRAYFFGVVRRTAQQVERSRARRIDPARTSSFDGDGQASDDASQSKLFDSMWAKGLVRRASRLYSKQAKIKGSAAQRRVDLLLLRFGEDLQIHEIASRWRMNPKRLHKDYAQAREEFRECLHEIIAQDNPGRPEVALQELALLADFL